MIGRRVDTIDDIERAGDYCLTDEVNHAGEKTGRGVWFLLPIHEGGSKYERVTRGSGLHRVSEPPWTFRECDDGSIEIRASIACGRGEPEGEYWHGYLDEGHVWRTVVTTCLPPPAPRAAPGPSASRSTSRPASSAGTASPAATSGDALRTIGR